MPVDMRIRHGQRDELEAFQRLLGRLDNPLPEDVFTEGGNVMLTMLTTYPPARPGSTYERTGALGQGWRVTANPNQFRARNDVSYASYVQGKFQRWYHRETGWRSPRQVWDERGEVVKVRLRGALFRVWSKRGL